MRARSSLLVLSLVTLSMGCATAGGDAPSGGVCESAANCFEFCLCTSGDVVRCKDACEGQNAITQNGPWPGGAGAPGGGGQGGSAGGPGGSGGQGGVTGEPPQGGAAGAPSGGASSGGASSGGSSSSGGSASGGASSGGTSSGGTSGGGSSSTGALAAGLSISEIAIYQGVKIPIMKAGAAVSQHNAPIVAGRPGLVRVFVTPESGFSSRQIAARLELSSGGTLEKSITVSGGSSDSSTSSTFNFELSGANVASGTTYSVSLHETSPSAPSGSTAGARFPASGATSLGAKSAGGALDVVLVPIVVNGLTPDTSPARVQAYKDRLTKLFPVPNVNITVRSAVTYSGNVTALSGGSWSTALDFLYGVRSSDKPAKDVYYYGVLTPKSSFSSYCGGACIAGISAMASASDTYSRGSIGLGYFTGGNSNDSPDVMAHELGHAHGLPHAPCGVSNAGSFPYSGAKIGVWGYDILDKTLMSPTSRVDVMSYCDPTWISDYNFDKLFTRVSYVHANQSFKTVDPSRAPGRFRAAILDEHGKLSWGQSHDLSGPVLGEQRSVRLRRAWGSDETTGFFYPLSHAAGGILLVRESKLQHAASLSTLGAAEVSVPEAVRRGR